MEVIVGAATLITIVVGGGIAYGTLRQKVAGIQAQLDSNRGWRHSHEQESHTIHGTQGRIEAKVDGVLEANERIETKLDTHLATRNGH